MNNFNPSELIASDDNSVRDQIQRSYQYKKTLEDKANDQLKQTSEMIGGEFLKSSLDKLGSTVSKATGLDSLGALGENVKKLGYKKGLAKTMADAQKEGTQKAIKFGQDKVDDVTAKAQGLLDKATKEGTQGVSDFKGKVTTGLDDLKGKVSSGVDDLKGKVSSGVEEGSDELTNILGKGKANMARQVASNKINAQLRNKGLQELSEDEISNSKSVKDLKNIAKSKIQNIDKDTSDKNVIDKTLGNEKGEAYQQIEGEAQKVSKPKRYRLKDDYSEGKTLSDKNLDKINKINSEKQLAKDAENQGAKDVDLIPKKKITKAVSDAPDPLVRDEKGNILQDEADRITDKRFADIDKGDVDLRSKLEQKVQQQLDDTLQGKTTLTKAKEVSDAKKASQQLETDAKEPTQKGVSLPENDNIGDNNTLSQAGQDITKPPPISKPNVIEPPQLSVPKDNDLDEDEITDKDSSLEDRINTLSQDKQDIVKQGYSDGFESNVNKLKSSDLKNNILKSNYEKKLQSVKNNAPELLDDLKYPGASRKEFSIASSKVQDKLNSQSNTLSDSDLLDYDKNITSHPSWTNDDDLQKLVSDKDQTAFRKARNTNQSIEQEEFEKFSDATQAIPPPPAPSTDPSPAPKKTDQTTTPDGGDDDKGDGGGGDGEDDDKDDEDEDEGDGDEDEDEDLLKKVAGAGGEDEGEGLLATLGGIADPLIGGLEAVAGIGAMIIPSLFGGDNDDAESQPVMKQMDLSQTGFSGLGN